MTPKRESQLRAAGLVAEALDLLGVAVHPDTPGRWARALSEMTDGLSVADPSAVLGKTFEADCDEIVVVNGIRFVSVCEHHLLPFWGTASVAYLPARGRVVGLSKIPRLVTTLASRPQLQERLTRQIASSILDAPLLQPRAASCVISASHSCMAHRGARQPEAFMVTSAMLGLFRTDPSLRSEVSALMDASGHV